MSASGSGTHAHQHDDESQESEHDWHSAEYVADWIAQDYTHDARRRPILERMAALLPGAVGDTVRVLDVGGGYGVVSDAVLTIRPHATVTLHDFSEAMINQAASRLSQFADRLSFHQADLTDPHWIDGLDQPFDAVMSSRAIHNLNDPAVIARVYAEIHTLLRPGGLFLNYDIVFPAMPALADIYRRDPERHSAWDVHISDAGIRDQLDWLTQAGYAGVDCLHKDLERTLLCGVKAS